MTSALNPLTRNLRSKSVNPPWQRVDAREISKTTRDQPTAHLMLVQSRTDGARLLQRRAILLSLVKSA